MEKPNAHPNLNQPVCKQVKAEREAVGMNVLLESNTFFFISSHKKQPFLITLNFLRGASCTSLEDNVTYY